MIYVSYVVEEVHAIALEIASCLERCYARKGAKCCNVGLLVASSHSSLLHKHVSSPKKMTTSHSIVIRGLAPKNGASLQDNSTKYVYSANASARSFSSHFVFVSSSTE